MKKILTILFISLIVVSSTSAFAEDGEKELAMVGDALVGRPLGLASIAVGTSIFIISLPFTAISGSTEKAAKVLITNPVEYTFKRPLGEFDYKMESYKSQSKPSE